MNSYQVGCMIIPMSKRLLKRSFDKATYRFQDKPELLTVIEPKAEPGVDSPYGIYVHVPFCRSLCNFCPFYKELYNFSQCSKYVDAVISEIEKAPIEGEASWLYFGGGTPNMLTVHQLAQIKDAVQAKVNVEKIGIELLPDVLNAEYIKELRIAKFTKVSMGVESFQPNVLKGTGRSIPGKEGIAELVKEVKYRGLWLNLNFMIGLARQDRKSFLEDIKTASQSDTDQMTIYPFMRLGEIKTKASIPEKEQYTIIEEAGQILKNAGYKRHGLWTFSKGNDIYDFPMVEPNHDYFGFGPGAVSSYGQWKIVNPEVKVYLDNWKARESRGFVAERNKESDGWKKFARKLYDMDFVKTSEFVKEPRKIVNQLKKSGLIAKDGQLTETGINYAHDISKNIIENMPHPVRHVEKTDSYQAVKEESGTGFLD